MNDSTEYIFSLEYIKTKLKDLYEVEIKTSSAGSYTVLEAYCYGVEAKINAGVHHNVVQAFSFSLSEREDSLSQWRGYCPDGGYAISFFENKAFSRSQLCRMIDTNDLFIGKCLYTDTEHKTLLYEHIVGHTPESFLDYMDDTRRDSTKQVKSQGKYFLLDKILKNILTYAPFIKHNKFQDEQEWRIIASSDNQNYKRLIKFREGKGFIVPYLEIPLVEKDDQGELPWVQIDEIIVGPSPHRDLAVNACQLFRAESTTKVTSSSIPYRNW